MEYIPTSVDLWISYSRLATHSEARQILNKVEIYCDVIGKEEYTDRAIDMDRSMRTGRESKQHRNTKENSKQCYREFKIR